MKPAPADGRRLPRLLNSCTDVLRPRPRCTTGATWCGPLPGPPRPFGGEGHGGRGTTPYPSTTTAPGCRRPFWPAPGTRRGALPGCNEAGLAATAVLPRRMPATRARLLNTDWGDHGHWQYQPAASSASLPVLPWRAENHSDAAIADALDPHVFREPPAIAGRAACAGRYPQQRAAAYPGSPADHPARRPAANPPAGSPRSCQPRPPIECKPGCSRVPPRGPTPADPDGSAITPARRCTCRPAGDREGRQAMPAVRCGSKRTWPRSSTNTAYAPRNKEGGLQRPRVRATLTPAAATARSCRPQSGCDRAGGGRR